VIGFMLGVCVLLYPEMKGQMEQMNEMFASMGAFTQAFGMDRLNFGSLTGYYAIECGNVLGLGGAFFAALCGADILSKEEKSYTAEFLLTHPVRRSTVVTEKLLAVVVQVTALNVAVFAVSIGAMGAVGESIPWKAVGLLHLAYYLMMLEVGCIGFLISALLGKGSMGAGIGAAALLYMMNLIANITESAEFLKYITPFGYCDGADIVDAGNLDWVIVGIGAGIAACCVAVVYWWYGKKDIH
jgi:ABC-2 type transport system permease protein